MQYSTLVCFVALAAVACARPAQEVVVGKLDLTHDFQAFKAKFNKVYTASEEATREAAFNANMAFYRTHNNEYAQGLHTYTVGVNEFSDLTTAEFNKIYLRPFKSTRALNVAILPEATATSVDWRTSGAVTAIKNQGQCGSCWSFSTTGSVEGAWQIAGHSLVALSEQQLMDCSQAEGNQGCNGGLMDDAFTYIVKNGGIDTESDYPYTARDGKCNAAKAATKVAKISGFKDVAKNNEAQLVAAVTIGPVSVAIEADQAGFQGYTSGVFSGPCGTALDHGVLAVGFTPTYWIVKNSWGASWGDQGYIMMARGKGAAGICGINMAASYPTVAAAETPLVAAPPPPPPAGGHYGDPNAGACQSDEIAVEVTGVAGKFCSPDCSKTKPCPTDIPDAATAKPECILEAAGKRQPTNCVLVCAPAQDAQCPTKATCKAIQGIGICTYDS